MKPVSAEFVIMKPYHAALSNLTGYESTLRSDNGGLFLL
jgi:hypothetical protein